MNLLEAIEARHSVRSYDNKPLDPRVIETLERAVNVCNEESKLNIKLITEKPEVFATFKAKSMKISGVRNYISLAGKKSSDLEEKCGYYGEHIVLWAQQMGLNTCWLGATYDRNKTKDDIGPGEKQPLIIAIGKGTTQGTPRKSKSMKAVCGEREDDPNVPEWYKRGIKAALLAPTAVNQQKFTFTREGNRVSVKAGIGPFAKVDLGIVKCHFEIGAGQENFEWEQ